MKVDRESPANGRYTLHHLVNLQQLQETFIHFAGVTGLSATLYSFPQGELLMGNGRWDICSRCRHTAPDQDTSTPHDEPEPDFASQSASGIRLLPCACGFVTGVTPITTADGQIATLFSGQLLLAPPDLEQARQRGSALGYAPDDYLAALRAAPVIPEAHLTSSLNLLRQMVTLLAEQGLAQLNSRLAAKNLARLQNTLDHLNRLAEQSRIIIWEVNANGLYTAISQSIIAILGYKPEEVVSKMHFYDLFPKALRQELQTSAFATITQQHAFYAFENPLQTIGYKLSKFLTCQGQIPE